MAVIGVALAALIGGEVVGKLIRDAIALAERAITVGLVKTWVDKQLRDLTNPEEVLRKVVPAWAYGRIKEAMDKEKEVAGIVDFMNFLREFNLRFANMNISASVLSPQATYVATQIGIAYQWAYGLGWLSWMGTGELLRKAISEPIRKKLRKYFKLEELSESALRRCVILGIISIDDYAKEMENRGYPREEVERLIQSLKDDLVGDVAQKMVRLGLIDESVIIERLKELAVPESDARRIVKSFYKEPSLSILIKSFKARRIDEAALRYWLKLHGYSDEAIDLIIDSAKEERIEKDKELTKSDILNLYRWGIIKEQDAINLLVELGYEEIEARWLIDLVKARIAIARRDKGRDLSKSDILTAFRLGVLSEMEAKSLLLALGYDDTEVRILLDIQKKRMEKEPKERRRELAKSDIVKAFRLGIISKEDAENYLRQLGFKDEEIKVLIEMAEVLSEERRTLTVSQLGRAFREGIIDEMTFEYYLRFLGYGDFEIAVLKQLYYPRA